MYYYAYHTTINKLQQYELSFEEIMSGVLNTPTTVKDPIHVIRTIPIERLSNAMHEKYRNTINTLSHWIEQNSHIAYRTDDMSEFYRHFEVPKANGGTRPIDEPIYELKRLHQTLLAILQSFGPIESNNAYGYVQNRSIIDAQKTHQRRNHKYFLAMDLHNFFGSCTEDWIKTQLQQIPFFAAWKLQNETTYNGFIHICCLKGVLPQGSPLSPWLTNQLMVPIDYTIQQYCIEHNITYTRYADDMLFSANHRMSAIPLKVNQIISILSPLSINETKTKLTTNCGKNYHLGLLINKDNNITVGNKKKEIFRAQLTNFAHNHTTTTIEEAQSLLGLLNYYIQVEPTYFKNLLTKYNQKFTMNIEESLKTIIRTR